MMWWYKSPCIVGGTIPIFDVTGVAFSFCVDDVVDICWCGTPPWASLKASDVLLDVCPSCVNLAGAHPVCVIELLCCGNPTWAMLKAVGVLVDVCLSCVNPDDTYPD